MIKVQISSNFEEKKENDMLGIIRQMNGYSEILEKKGLIKDTLPWVINIFGLFFFVTSLGNLGVGKVKSLSLFERFLSSLMASAAFGLPSGFITSGLRRGLWISADTIVSDILAEKNYSIANSYLKRKRKKIDKLLEQVIGKILIGIKNNSLVPQPSNIPEFLDTYGKYEQFLRYKRKMIQKFSDKGFDMPVICSSLDDATKYSIIIDNDLITMDKSDVLIQMIDDNEGFELVTKETLDVSIDEQVTSAEKIINDDKTKENEKAYYRERLLLVLRYGRQQLETKQIEALAVEELVGLGTEKKSIQDSPQYTLYQRK